MAGFVLRKEDGIGEIEQWTISSLTLAVGDLLEMDAGATAATVADANTEYWQRMGVVRDATVSGIDTLVNVKLVNPRQIWEVQAANSTTTDDNGDRMILTDLNTVNNSSSDVTDNNALVVQTGIVGAATDYRILVRFMDASGIDPSATD